MAQYTYRTDAESIIAEQEKALQFPAFNSDIAFEIGTYLRSKYLATQSSTAAGERGGIVISITLFDGQILFQSTVGDAPAVGPANWSWVAGKTNTVKRFGISSALVGLKVKASGKSLKDKFYVQELEFAGSGGAFPIKIKGLATGPIGVIVISGLSQAEDHQYVVEAIQEHLKIPAEQRTSVLM